MSDEPRDNGFDDFLDAVEEDDPFYLESPSGDGWLPPREFDPESGERGLSREDMPETGEVLTSTVVNVAGPSFADDVPYVVAVAEFGPVRITGQVAGADEELDIGQDVRLDVGIAESTGDRFLAFDPV
jgi:uncharacterized OB-fold protein